MTGGLTGAHVVGEGGWTPDDNARDIAINAATAAIVALGSGGGTAVEDPAGSGLFTGGSGPVGGVTSVAGRSGAVVLTNTDVSGLGNAATRSVGTTTGTVAAGDDSRFGTGGTGGAVVSVAGRTGAVVLANTDISGLGNSSTRNVGTTTGTVAAGNDSRFSSIAPVTSVAGRTGAVVLANTDISGLGNVSTRNVGTTSGTAAAGDDSRFSTTGTGSPLPSATDWVIWVAPSGSDSTGNGQSPGSAFRTLTHAVANLPGGSTTPATIRLTPGAYTEPGSIDLGSRQNLAIIGSGLGVTVLTFSGTGSSIISHWAVNTSNASRVTIRDLSIVNGNGSNVGAGIEQRAGGLITISQVQIGGHKYGIIFDQTEISYIDLCDFGGQITAGVWFTHDAGWTATASSSIAFTNSVAVTRCNFNEPSAISIIDDGGWNHLIEGNSFNVGTNQIIVAGLDGGVIRGNEMEGATSVDIVVTSVTHLLGTAVGSCYGLLIAHNIIDTSSTGHAGVNFTAGAVATLLANSISSTTYSVTGMANFSSATWHLLTAIGNVNGTSGVAFSSLFDATNAQVHVL